MDTNQNNFKQIQKVEVKKQFKVSKKLLIGIVIVLILCIIGTLSYNYVKKNNGNYYTTSIKGGSSKILTGDVTVTKQGYYEYLLDNYGANQVINDAYNSIADKLITDTKAINSLVESKKKQYAQYYGTLKSYASTQNLTEKEFIDNVITPEAKQELLVKKYLNDEFTSIVNKYHPTYIKAITFTKESDALKAKKTVKSSSDYAKLQKKYKSNYTDYSLISSVSDSSSVDSNLIKQVKAFASLNKDGVYKDAIKLSTGSYALVYVYNTNANDHKNDIINTLSSNSTVKTDTEVYYLNKYDFTVYDKKLKKSVKSVNSKYLK